MFFFVEILFYFHCLVVILIEWVDRWPGFESRWIQNLLALYFECCGSLELPGDNMRRFSSCCDGVITDQRRHYEAGYRTMMFGCKLISKIRVILMLSIKKMWHFIRCFKCQGTLKRFFFFFFFKIDVVTSLLSIDYRLDYFFFFQDWCRYIIIIDYNRYSYLI